jgi:hypothetical protein
MQLWKIPAVIWPLALAVVLAGAIARALNPPEAPPPRIEPPAEL